jgi:hypothetical protein
MTDGVCNSIFKMTDLMYPQPCGGPSFTPIEKTGKIALLCILICMKTDRNILHSCASVSFRGKTLNEAGLSGQRHAPAALYPRGNDPRYPLYRRLGGPQSRSGHRD